MALPRFRLRSLLIVFVALGVVCATAAWYIRKLQPIEHLPRCSAAECDVTWMTASYMEPPNWRMHFVDIARPQIPQLLDLLRAGRVDINPAKWIVLGELECGLQAGGKTDIDLFYIDGKKMAYRTDPHEYFRGVDAIKVMKLIHAGKTK